MQTHNNPDGTELNVPIWLAAKEFRNLYKALVNYTDENNQSLNIDQLMISDSTKEILDKQGIDTETPFTFLSALARAESEYHKVWSAPKGQMRGKRTF